MTRVLVTGSSRGIGRQTAQDLVAAGAEVVLHVRSQDRVASAMAQVPGAAEALVGDLSSLRSTRAMAEGAGHAFDVVVHNAGVGGTDRREVTGDGLLLQFQVNVLAPYVLTALLPRPRRAVYLTSGLQEQGDPGLDDLQWERRKWNGHQAYSDSKLFDVMLAFWVARSWPGTVSSAVDPGWIKTDMGGRGATDELPEGAETQVWLATSDDPAALESGRYVYRRQPLRANPAAYDQGLQEELVRVCARLSGVPTPV